MPMAVKAWGVNHWTTRDFPPPTPNWSLLRATGLPCQSVSTPGMCQPQGLCIGHSLCLELSFPRCSSLRHLLLSLLKQPFKKFFWSCCTACEILVPLPGIVSVLLEMQVRSFSHWTHQESPWFSFFAGRSGGLNNISPKFMSTRKLRICLYLEIGSLRV